MSGGDNWTEAAEVEQVEWLRQPLLLFCIYCVAYGAVFALGLVGNAFVVAAVLRNASMRNITNYCITSLAAADLLIIIFCLPATLVNNVLAEWPLGAFLCKLSVWLNGSASCISVLTLVAVTADRYCAICHTLRYNAWPKQRTLAVIVPIWAVSALLFTPWFVYFDILYYRVENTTLVYRLCYPLFPDATLERTLFLVVNFIIAFVIPLGVISCCYGFIFHAIYTRSSRCLAIAVDRHAAEREHRVKVRVTYMMLSVIVMFAASWLPLYSLYMYFKFGGHDRTSSFGQLASAVLRPVFQWLSLANSSINPLLYAYFSQRFRQAFHELLVRPCRQRYQRVRRLTHATVKRFSDGTQFMRSERQSSSPMPSERSMPEMFDLARTPSSRHHLRHYRGADQKRTSLHVVDGDSVARLSGRRGVALSQSASRQSRTSSALPNSTSLESVDTEPTAEIVATCSALSPVDSPMRFVCIHDISNV